MDLTQALDIVRSEKQKGSTNKIISDILTTRGYRVPKNGSNPSKGYVSYLISQHLSENKKRDYKRKPTMITLPVEERASEPLMFCLIGTKSQLMDVMRGANA